MAEGTRTHVLTVRGFLDAALSPARRIHHLDDLCIQLTRQPLDTTVASLREVIAHRIDLEDYRRLHVLISHLYHRAGASIPLVTCLHTEVNTALARSTQATPADAEGR